MNLPTAAASPTTAELRAAGFLAALRRTERFITVAAFLVLIGTVFLDVVSRELTGRGLYWALQAGVYANVVVVLVGLGLASQDGAHLRPQFADRWLPVEWEPVLKRVAEFLMAAFCLVFAAVAAQVVAETRLLGERSPVLGTLVWPVQALIPLVFALAAVRHFLFGWWPGLAPRPVQPAE